MTGRLYGDDTIFDRKRGVLDSGYATSQYIGPLSGLDFNSGFAGNTSSSHFSSEPAKLATQTLDNSMRHSGIKISPTVALGKTPKTAKAVAVIRSQPLTQIVNTTDVYSDNFFAEMLEKLLGARFGGAGTTAAGTTWWRDSPPKWAPKSTRSTAPALPTPTKPRRRTWSTCCSACARPKSAKTSSKTWPWRATKGRPPGG